MAKDVRVGLAGGAGECREREAEHLEAYQAAQRRRTRMFAAIAVYTRWLAFPLIAALYGLIWWGLWLLAPYFGDLVIWILSMWKAILGVLVVLLGALLAIAAGVVVGVITKRPAKAIKKGVVGEEGAWALFKAYAKAMKDGHCPSIDWEG